METIPQVLTLLIVMKKWKSPSQAGTLSQIHSGGLLPCGPKAAMCLTPHILYSTEPGSLRVEIFIKSTGIPARAV